MTDEERPAPRETSPGTVEPGPPASPSPEPEGGAPRPVDYDPPWQEARRRVKAAWSQGGTWTRVALIVGGVTAVGLLGAFLFGLWHVVVGGFVKGNWEAAGFGFALAGVTGVLLWLEASIARRLLPPAAASRGDVTPEALP